MQQEVSSASEFSGKTFVMRLDEASAEETTMTLVDDLRILAEHGVRSIVVAPDPVAARSIVRSVNRSTNIALALSGSDAGLLPRSPDGRIGRVQTGILDTLTCAGYIPVVEPTAFAVFAEKDPELGADEVAAAIAIACDAARAIFFHQAGSVPDPKTHQLIDELTPAEALALADDPRVAVDLRAAIRAAAMGVRSGIGAAQILDGRVAHATVVEVLTTQHIGTQVTGGIILAA
jgi:acetylglutamate kinase